MTEIYGITPLRWREDKPSFPKRFKGKTINSPNTMFSADSLIGIYYISRHVYRKEHSLWPIGFENISEYWSWSLDSDIFNMAQHSEHTIYSGSLAGFYLHEDEAKKAANKFNTHLIKSALFRISKFSLINDIQSLQIK